MDKEKVVNILIDSYKDTANKLNMRIDLNHMKFNNNSIIDFQIQLLNEGNKEFMIEGVEIEDVDFWKDVKDSINKVEKL